MLPQMQSLSPQQESSVPPFLLFLPDDDGNDDDGHDDRMGDAREAGVAHEGSVSARDTGSGAWVVSRVMQQLNPMVCS